MSEQVPLSDIKEEGSRNVSRAPSYHAPNETDIKSTSAPPPVSPNVPHKRPGRARRGSVASHVDVDFFDPEGARQLERTMSRMSSRSRPVGQHREESLESDRTLSAGEGPFDFEKTLRDILKRYVDFHRF